MAEVIKLASIQNQNVVIIHEHKEPKKYKKLHIWWDDQQKNTSELNVLLAHMLQKSHLWKKSDLFLKEVTNNEMERENKLKKYKTFFKESRLLIDIDLKVASNSEEKEHLMTKTAKSADFCFFSLKPIQKEESLEVYADYLKSVFEKTKDYPSCAFVTAYQINDLKQILTA